MGPRLQRSDTSTRTEFFTRSQPASTACTIRASTARVCLQTTHAQAATASQQGCKRAPTSARASRQHLWVAAPEVVADDVLVQDEQLGGGTLRRSSACMRLACASLLRGPLLLPDDH